MLRMLDEHVNAHSTDSVSDEMREQFGRTHRTLQRGIFVEALLSIALMAQKEHTDLRNELAQRSAQELIDSVEWLPDGRPPMI